MQGSNLAIMGDNPPGPEITQKETLLWQYRQGLAY